jgi:LuxR family maltose regulon positive regulatory protein
LANSDWVRGGNALPESGEAVVLETKLTRPPVRSKHLPRPSLLATLDAAASRKLTLLAAPPGFGKSTLLAEWAAAQAAARVAWLSLDESDNDPARFFTYVASALQRGAPELGNRATASIGNPGADLLEIVLPRLLNELASLGSDLVLVVEDYHVITRAEVHQALTYLIERSPKSLRLVLSTRQDPPLPLGRLRARGDLAELRANDLRFSDEEAEAFLVGELDLALSDADVALLQARTEGWPAALYLAALSLRGRTDASDAIEQFAGDDRYVVDFLTTEALARQTPELRSFLLRTSILRRFNGALCDVVAERHDSAERLTELERSNLFIVPLDSRRAWYRYHHLFGDLLRHELEATKPAELPVLHRRASAWYRDAGLIVDAADHAIAGADLDAVAELVGRHYGLFVDHGQLATVIDWLRVMPDSVIGEDWLLGFAGAVVYAHAGQLDEAERWLRLAAGAPQLERDGQDPAQSLAAIAGAIRLLRGDVAGAISNARRALESPIAADPIGAFGPQMVLASGLWWSDQAAEATAVVDDAARTARAARYEAGLVYALGVRGAMALDMHELTAAASLADEAVELIRTADLEGHPWAGMAHISHGVLLSQRGDLDDAAEAIERGIRLGEQMQAWQVTVYGSLALAEVRQRQQNPSAARRLISRARSTLEALPDPGDGLLRVERTEKALKLRATRHHRPADAAYWELSQREMDVLRLLPGSLSQREIAAELYVSFNTVRTHTRVIFSKLGVTSRTEAVERARELGLL